jgi:four helix bundle protein
MQDYRNLKVWQRAHGFALDVYRLTNQFPPDERFGLTSQIRRSAVSVPANIAEGSTRGSDPDFARFLIIAVGSATEQDYRLLLARDLEFIEVAAYQKLAAELTEIRKMLNGFLQKLKDKG